MAFPTNPTTTKTTDDTGCAVPLWTPWCAEKDAVSKETRERIQLALQANQTEAGQVAWGCGMVAVVIVLVLILPFDSWVLGGVALFLVLGMLAMQRLSTIRRSESNVRSTLLAMHCCASCAYSLDGVPAGENHLTRCPECRAAWQLPEGHSQPPGDRPVWRWNTVERLLVDAGLGFMLTPRAHSGVDARGRAVEVVYPVPARRPPTQWNTIPDEESRIIQRKLRALNHWNVFMFVVVTCFLALVHVPRGITRIAAGGAGWDSYFWMMFAGFFAIMTFVRIRYPIIFNKRKISDVLVQHHRCGSCAGDLSGGEVEDDGLTVCPLCRAAWQVQAPFRLRARDPQRTLSYAPPRD